jgi:hypothetical protein
MSRRRLGQWFQFRLSTGLVLLAIVGWIMAFRPIFDQEMVTYYRKAYSVEESARSGREFGPELRVVHQGVETQWPTFHYRGSRTQWERRLSSSMYVPLLALAALVAWKAGRAIVCWRKQPLPPDLSASPAAGTPL